jgi:hypothetical protein
MPHALFLTAALAADPLFPEAALDFEKLTAVEARALHGRPVRVSFAALPAYHAAGCTVTGSAGSDVERAVYLPGDVEVEAGKRLTVAGLLREIRHDGRGPFPGFTEIRIEGATVIP